MAASGPDELMRLIQDGRPESQGLIFLIVFYSGTVVYREEMFDGGQKKGCR
jgi:hypothetical protein